MKSRTFFLTLISFVLLIGCAANKSGAAFTVKGKIINATAMQIALDELNFGDLPPKTVDTATVAKDGSFTLKAKGVGKGAICRLVIDGNQSLQWIFINEDNSDVSIQLNANDLMRSTIKGSAATQELYSFFDIYRKKDSLLMNDIKLKDSLQQMGNRTPAQDSLMKTLASSQQKQIEDLNNQLKTFVTSAKSPTAAYFVLVILGAGTIPQNEFITLANDVAKKYEGYAPLQEFVKKINDHSGGDKAAPEVPDASAYPLLNKQAPDLAMQTPEGKTVKISDFRGKYVLVDFWASWCGPCRAENPFVVAAYNKFKDKNFTILGVSLDKNKSKWINAIQKDGLVWTQMSDLNAWESAAVEPYMIKGIPFNVLIDPSGKIIASGLREEALEAKLRSILK